MTGDDDTPVSADEARAAWSAGVNPLRTAFPREAETLLRAVAFSFRASMPVPIVITGGSRTGKTTLVRALGDLAGAPELTVLPRNSLSSIRKAVRPGQPLLVDDFAPADSHARRSLLEQVEGEHFAVYFTPLHQPSLLVVTGDQPLPPRMSRVITVQLHRPRTVAPLRAAGSEPATKARRVVGRYLRQRALFVDPDPRALRIVRTRLLANERRRGAALLAGDQILRELTLTPAGGEPTRWLEGEDRIVWAVRDALQYLLRNGARLSTDPHGTADWTIGRRHDTHLTVRPSETLPFIRTYLGDDNLTSRDVADALRRTGYIRGDATTSPVRVDGTISRSWRIGSHILD